MGKAFSFLCVISNNFGSFNVADVECLSGPRHHYEPILLKVGEIQVVPIELVSFILGDSGDNFTTNVISHISKWTTSCLHHATASNQ